MTLRDHKIQYEDTDILSTTVHYHTCLQREAIEIFKQSNNFNRKEETRKIDKVWIPILRKTKIKPIQHDKLGEETSNQTPDLKADQSTKSRTAQRMHHTGTINMLRMLNTAVREFTTHGLWQSSLENDFIELMIFVNESLLL